HDLSYQLATVNFACVRLESLPNLILKPQPVAAETSKKTTNKPAFAGMRFFRGCWYAALPVPLPPPALQTGLPRCREPPGGQGYSWQALQSLHRGSMAAQESRWPSRGQ